MQEGSRRPVEKNMTTKPLTGLKLQIDNPMLVVNKEKGRQTPNQHHMF